MFWGWGGPVWSELSTANLGQEQKLQDRHKHFFYTHFDGLTSVFFYINVFTCDVHDYCASGSVFDIVKQSQ